jgi:hypothetical protein
MPALATIHVGERRLAGRQQETEKPAAVARLSDAHHGREGWVILAEQLPRI